MYVVQAYNYSQQQHLPTHDTRFNAPPTSASIVFAQMHPVVSNIAEYVAKYHQLVIPLSFSTLAAIANVQSPVQHSLLVTAASCFLIWLYLLTRVGIRSSALRQNRKTSWLAGAFIALSQICDRAACDKEGIWVTKVRRIWPRISISGH